MNKSKINALTDIDQRNKLAEQSRDPLKENKLRIEADKLAEALVQYPRFLESSD